MLINLRNALMTGKRLPYDAELEFLESTGTQWIDTGVIPDRNTKLSVTASATATTEQFMGAIDASSNRFHFSFYSAGYFRGCVGMQQTGMGSADQLVHTFTLDAPNNTVSEDGTSYSFVQKGYVPSVSIWLFGRNSNYPMYVRRIKVRICSCQIYQNGVLVRDFIPVRKGTVGYLYDRVSGKLFGNDGTGDFVLGPDVVPVEYIESHGTEYIDTGVPARTGLATDIVCAITQAQNDTAVCGAKGTSNNRCVPVAFFSSDSTTALVYGNGNRNTDSIYAQYYPEVGRMVRYQSEISTGAISLNIDGTAYTRTMQTSTINAGTTLRMFAREWNGTISAYSKIRMASALFDLDGERVRKYLPVRVGTEGAMMDVLTRRIYRNAGTGAFGYGNDLRYPIPAS